MPSDGAVAAALVREPHNPWLLRLPSGTKGNAVGQEPLLSLFCFPPAGSGGGAFVGWSAALPQVEVLPVELPGRSSRAKEAPFTSMAALIDVLLPALLPELQRRSFAFFGHSMGAWVAFALVQELAKRGGPLPMKLYASANRCPLLAGTEQDVDPTVMHMLSPEAFWPAMTRRYGRNPDLEHPAVQRLLLPTLRADFQLIETWRPEQRVAQLLPCAVAALGGRQDTRYTPQQLAAWEEVAPPGAFEQRWFEGGHSYISASSSGRGREALLAWLGGDLVRLLPLQQKQQQQRPLVTRLEVAEAVTEGAVTGAALGATAAAMRQPAQAPEQQPSMERAEKQFVGAAPPFDPAQQQQQQSQHDVLSGLPVHAAAGDGVPIALPASGKGLSSGEAPSHNPSTNDDCCCGCGYSWVGNILACCTCSCCCDGDCFD